VIQRNATQLLSDVPWAANELCGFEPTTSRAQRKSTRSIVMIAAITGSIVFLVTLFFSPKFIVHRVLGLAYLIQWAAALYLYFADYDYFYNSILIWSLPLTGFTQSIVASLSKLSFSLLPTQLTRSQPSPSFQRNKMTLAITETSPPCLITLFWRIFILLAC
jgi:hypothetical protein